MTKDNSKLFKDVRSAFADFKKERSRQFYPHFFSRIDILEQKVLSSLYLNHISKIQTHEAILRLLEDD